MNNNGSTEILENTTSITTTKPCPALVSYDDQVSSIATATINGLFSPVAILLNCLIMVLVCRTPSLRDRPENILIVGLSFADFMTGLLTQPLFVFHKILWLKCNPVRGKINFLVLSSMVLCSGSAFALIAALSLEKILALHFHLRYNSVITTARTWALVSLVWLANFLLSLLLVSQVADYQFLDIICSLIGSICVMITLLAHLRIFATVRRHRRQISAQITSIARTHPSVVQIQKTRWQTTLQETKRAMNLAYFVGLYLIFFTPQFALQLHKFVKNKEGTSLTIYYFWTETVLFIRASFSPVVWFVRKRELRNAFNIS